MTARVPLTEQNIFSLKKISYFSAAFIVHGEGTRQALSTKPSGSAIYLFKLNLP